MLLSIDDFVALLRSSVNVQSEESEVIDPAYLQMTDDEIKLFIKLGVSRAYPNITDLAQLPSGSEYPVIMLAKIELYLKLAVLKADKVDLGADNNNYLKLDQRFQHYMKLVGEARAEYDSWLSNEGQGEVRSFEVLLDNRHYTHRNFEKQLTPKVSVIVDSVSDNEVKYHFNVADSSHFGRFKVYIDEFPIFDIHKEGYKYSDKISQTARLILSTGNIRNVYHSIGNLEPEKTYYLLVVEIERNQIYGFNEISFTTLPLFKDEEDFDIDNL